MVQYQWGQKGFRPKPTMQGLGKSGMAGTPRIACTLNFSRNIQARTPINWQ